MSLAEIEALRAMLASRPKDTPLAARRAGFEAMMARPPLPPGTRWQSVEIAPGLAGEIVTAPEADAGDLLVWLHGGQFAIGSAASYRGFAARVSAAAGVAVLVPDYRLAPENVFPAAHDDADAALAFARANSRCVALGGDSAGASLAAAALVRCVADDARSAPVRALWLLSPYLDLTHKAPSIPLRAARDPFVDPAEMDAVARRYLGTADPADPRASPLFGPVAAGLPTLIQVGSDEALFDDAARYAARLAACTFQEWAGMIHVWPLFADRLEEGRWAIAQAGVFLRRSFAL